MSSPVHHALLTCGNYPQQILLVVSRSAMDAESILRDELDYEISDDLHANLAPGPKSAAHTVQIDDDGLVIIWLNRAKISLLAHELLHAVMFVLAFCGVPVSTQDDETAAYLLQHLTSQALSQSWRWLRS